MLETIKRLIKEPCISFGQFFQNYVMSVQDESIKQEISFLLRNNFLSAGAMEKLINKELKEQMKKQ